MQMCITIWGSSGKITGNDSVSSNRWENNHEWLKNGRIQNGQCYLGRVWQQIGQWNCVSRLYAIVTLANLSGNGISLFLLLMRTSPKTPSIIFMINLTITDLIVGAVLPFQIAYQMQGHTGLWEQACAMFWQWFSSLTCTAPFYSWPLLAPTATWG